MAVAHLHHGSNVLQREEDEGLGENKLWPLEYFWLQINLKVFLAMGVAVAMRPFSRAKPN